MSECLWSLLSPWIGSLFVDVLKPMRETGVDVLVVLAPGALTAAEAYIPLAKHVQQSYDGRLWFAIIKLPGIAPPGLMTKLIEAGFSMAVDKVTSMGFTPGHSKTDNIFIAGHSFGSYNARPVALQHAQGFIQLGGSFCAAPPGVADNLPQFPRSVLTMNGELDGQVTFHPTAKHAGEILAVQPGIGSFNTYARKPVIAIPGMNHAQFSHGKPDKKRGDIDAEITLEQARTTARELISAFLTVNVASSPSNVAGAALVKLETAVKQTHEMCKVFWEAISAQGKDAERYQRQFLQEDVGITVVEHEFKDNFKFSRPWIEGGSKAIVPAFLSPTEALSKNFGVIKSLWMKMIWEGDSPYPAAKSNEDTFNVALRLVPEKARTRYKERGKKAKFLDDMVKTSHDEWLEKDLIVTVTGSNVEVQAIVLVAAGFAGAKLLTIAGAMQIIFTLCLQDVCHCLCP